MFDTIKTVHIIGIGGCAASAIGEYLLKNGLAVSGSEAKKRSDLEYLEELGARITYGHNRSNLYQAGHPDIVLYSPAVIALNPDNPELLEGKEKNIPLMSWQQFIGSYLHSLGKRGITVSGSEGKGTTAGILTMLLKGSTLDPLAILGAKIKNLGQGQDSNIYVGTGEVYILEGDEYNRNFFNYRPSINIMINLKYEHPETYRDFAAYRQAFSDFFSTMTGDKLLILHATPSIVSFAEEYRLDKTHRIIWFGSSEETGPLAQAGKIIYTITDHILAPQGNTFSLCHGTERETYTVPSLPGYLAYNATGAIIAALSLGFTADYIRKKLLDFTGMVRRFDMFRTRDNGIIITDYGHSPESIEHINHEIRSIFKDKKVHLIFQPHLFSRTYNFAAEFARVLLQADKVTLIDIYPARENPQDWEDKISAPKLLELMNPALQDTERFFYAGPSSTINSTVLPRIDPSEITCFIGAGDMDRYYQDILAHLGAVSYF